MPLRVAASASEKISDVERMVTMRVDELPAAPALKPSSTARSDANRKTATATLSTVSAVRRLLRRALFRIRRQELHAATNVPFSRCSTAARALGGVRIVRHHDDRLLELGVQPLQQSQDLLARLGVEIAGRLVGEQQRRVGDDGARDRDALLLAAGELARVVLRPDR